MADTNEQKQEQQSGENKDQNQQETKTAGKFVSAGKPQPKGDSTPVKEVKKEKPAESTDTKTKDEKEGTDDSKNDNADDKKTGKEAEKEDDKEKSSSQTPELTREQIKEIFGFDGTPAELKAHLEKQAALKNGKDGKKDEQTNDDDKTKKEKDLEKRIVDRFVAENGSYENYVLLKQLAEADPKDLSLRDLKRELKEAGFSDDESDAIIRERYFEISDDDIAQFTDETDKQFETRKREYGQKKRDARGLQIQKKAKEALEDLRKAIEEEDADVQEEAEIVSMVETAASKYERKFSFEMGEIAGKQIAPVEFELSESEIAEAVSPLKDPSERNKILFTDGEKLNVDYLSNLLIRNAALEKVAKAAYADGCTRTVEEFKQVFPENAHAVGIGGNGAASKNGGGTKGKLISAGKPQVGR